MKYALLGLIPVLLIVPSQSFGNFDGDKIDNLEVSIIVSFDGEVDYEQFKPIVNERILEYFYERRNIIYLIIKFMAWVKK